MKKILPLQKNKPHIEYLRLIQDECVTMNKISKIAEKSYSTTHKAIMYLHTKGLCIKDIEGKMWLTPKGFEQMIYAETYQRKLNELKNYEIKYFATDKEVPL